MFTSRTPLLTAAGLLTSFVATAQTAAPLPPANQDMLSWMLRVLLCAVVLVAVLAGIALTTAAASRQSFAQQPAPSSLLATVPAIEITSAPAVAAQVAAPVVPATTIPAAKTALAPELVLSA